MVCFIFNARPPQDITTLKCLHLTSERFNEAATLVPFRTCDLVWYLADHHMPKLMALIEKTIQTPNQAFISKAKHVRITFWNNFCDIMEMDGEDVSNNEDR